MKILITIALMISLIGCAANVQPRARLSPGVPEEVASPDRLLEAAIRLKSEGRFSDAADAFEEAARLSTRRDIGLAVHSWEDAAVCRLAAGDTDRFVIAIDSLWRAGDDWTRREMDDDARALIALADRITGRAPRVELQTLPPEIRSLLESPPVPAFRLITTEEAP